MLPTTSLFQPKMLPESSPNPSCEVTFCINGSDQVGVKRGYLQCIACFLFTFYLVEQPKQFTSKDFGIAVVMWLLNGKGLLLQPLHFCGGTYLLSWKGFPPSWYHVAGRGLQRSCRSKLHCKKKKVNQSVDCHCFSILIPQCFRLHCFWPTKLERKLLDFFLQALVSQKLPANYLQKIH